MRAAGCRLRAPTEGRSAMVGVPLNVSGILRMPPGYPLAGSGTPALAARRCPVPDTSLRAHAVLPGRRPSTSPSPGQRPGERCRPRRLIRPNGPVLRFLLRPVSLDLPARDNGWWDAKGSRISPPTFPARLANQTASCAPVSIPDVSTSWKTKETQIIGPIPFVHSTLAFHTGGARFAGRGRVVLGSRFASRGGKGYCRNAKAGRTS
jgi:hypothetical protein